MDIYDWHFMVIGKILKPDDLNWQGIRYCCQQHAGKPAEHIAIKSPTGSLALVSRKSIEVSHKLNKGVIGAKMSMRRQYTEVLLFFGVGHYHWPGCKAKCISVMLNE